VSTGSVRNSRSCVNCGAGVTGALCGICGFQQASEDGFAAEITLDRMHAFSTSAGVVNVVHTLGETGSGERYLVEDAAGDRFDLVVYADDASQEERERLRRRLGNVMRSPVATGTSGARPLEMFASNGARSLTSIIAAAVAERDTNCATELAYTWVKPLVDCVAALHDNGLFLGGPGPDAFAFDSEGACVLTESADVRPYTEPEAPSRRLVVDGFSAPELYGRGGGQVGLKADVYFLGCVLYSLIARIVPLRECAARVQPLPTPRAYHDDIAPMLTSVAQRATAVACHRRYESAREMADALTNALNSAEDRANIGLRTLDVQVGHEIHIGLIKGLYSPINQDDYFYYLDELSGVGVFFVTDGVSISHYGTGDVASGCVRDAAQALSEHLRAPTMADGSEDTLVIAESDLTAVENQLPDDAVGRFALLGSVLDNANAEIGLRVMPELPVSADAPAGIMAATAVGLLLEKNRASFTYIGDSRIYLIRDGHIAQLSVDHNLKTQLIRNGRAPSMARQVPGANALVQCVGEFERAANGALLPVPLMPEFLEIKMLPGDYLVLCSDGLTDYAGFDEEDSEVIIRRLVEEAPDCRTAAFDLMVAANRGGGGDNICCIVLSFQAPDDHGVSL
jgi:serine/threonine protein phosphatase PrpC